MIFSLMHKDIKVLDMDFSEDFTYINKVVHIYNESHAPINLINNETPKIENGLTDWWHGRIIPLSRKNLQEALRLLNNSTTTKLAIATSGLSLSDHYWVRPEYLNFSYGEVNFYENNFSDDVGNALFGNLSKTNNIDFLSPNTTSNGWLPKKWIIGKDNKRYLIKGSGTFLQEPANEIITSEICKLLDIEHVPYFFARENNMKYSACPDFIDNLSTELVYANRIRLTKKQKNNNQNKYDSFLEKCSICGFNDIEYIKKKIAQMVLIDYIIRNEDRHFENFGFLRNPDTLEWIGFAPLYDNGTSLFCNTDCQYINNPKAEPKILHVPFSSSIEKQLITTNVRKYCSDIELNKLSNIIDFANDIFSTQSDFSTERRNLICSNLSLRLSQLNKFMNNEIEKIPLPRYRKIADPNFNF